MSKVIGFSHVAIKTKNYGEAIRFYTEGLGIKAAQLTEHSAVLRLPDGIVIEVFDGGEQVTNDAGCTHFCMIAHNVHAAMKRAVEYGATVKKEVYPLGDLRIGFVIAPTGEEVEFWDVEAKGGEPDCDENGCYVKSFVHPAFTVADMDASIKFYEALGIKYKTGWGWGCSMIMDDNREMELFTGGYICDNKSGITHACFRVDDIEGVLKKAVEAGGEITDYPNSFENIKFAFFRALSGEIIELFEMDPDIEPGMFVIPVDGPRIK